MSNRDRTSAMQDRLIRAAREHFVANGYAGAGTPAIVAAAEVTRGALYHHFADKPALFRAVLEREAEAVARAIDAADAPETSAIARLLSGAEAYLAAMEVPGRARLLLVDGPAALGPHAVRAIEARGGGDASLKVGLAEAIAAGDIADLPLDPLASLLSAMFERAALDIAAGAPPAPVIATVRGLLAGLSGSGRRQAPPGGGKVSSR